MIYIHIKHKDTYIGAGLTYLLIYIKHTMVFIEVIDLNKVADRQFLILTYNLLTTVVALLILRHYKERNLPAL